MRIPIRILFTLAGMVLAGQAAAEIRIGLAAPLSGPSALLGEQMRAGAETAAQALKDPAVTLEIVDDSCTAAGGARAARQFVAARVQAVVGFLCGEAIEAALPILKEAGIATIAVGVRLDSLTDRKVRTGWSVYRLGPRADSEREAAGRLLSRLWQKDLFAIVDDGTIYGREISESVRLAAEQAGLKPVFVDTFRPQADNQIGMIGRLKRAGATHVFVGGDAGDVAVMGRDAAELEADLVIAAGETLRALPGDVPLAAGTLMVAPPEWRETADPVASAAFAERNVLVLGYVLPAYAAVEIARQAIMQSGTPDAPLSEDLSNREFSTALGAVKFDAKGDLAENPYRLFRFDGTGFKPTVYP